MTLFSFDKMSQMEGKLVAEAHRNYGRFYENTVSVNSLLLDFLVTIHRSQTYQVFLRFIFLTRKHYALAVLSTIRRHEVQAMMNMRQVLEAGVCATWGMANPDSYLAINDSEKFLKKVVYPWIEDKHPAYSTRIKEHKHFINNHLGHANIVNAAYNYSESLSEEQVVYEFFDRVGDGGALRSFVELNLWKIADAALCLMNLINVVSRDNSDFVFAENFIPRIEEISLSQRELSEVLKSNISRVTVQTEEVGI